MTVVLDVSSLRALDAEMIRVCPLKDRTVAFILIQDGEVLYANTVGGKRELLRDAIDNEGVLLVAWPGAWSQDVFSVDPRALVEPMGGTA